MDKILLIQIFVSVIIGIISAAYFYSASGIFLDSLRKPLRLIGFGMLIISFGVLLAAFISYESSLGFEFYVGGYPLAVFFYIIYLFGSIFIALGSKMLVKKPKPIGAVL